MTVLATPLFLEKDTIEHIDLIADQLSKQGRGTVSRSGAVAWLVRKHRKKVVRQAKTQSLRVA